MRHVELHALKLQHVAVLEITIRRHIAQAGEAILHGGAFDLVEPELVVLVRPDHGNARALADFVSRARMIEMAMRQPHLLQREPEML